MSYRYIFALVLLSCLDSNVVAKDLVTKQVEDHFGIYVVAPGRRNPSDRATVKKLRSGKYYAVMYYWRNLDKRNPADVICDAYTWLLKGRNAYGQGAQKAFAKFEAIDGFELRFFDMAFAIKPGNAKGSFLSTHKAKQYMQVRVSRNDLRKTNFNQQWINRQIDEGQCQNLKQLFSKVEFDRDYIRRKST